MVSRIKKLLILFKSYFSEKEDTDFLRIDKGIGDKILFSPVYIMLIILLFSNATWYEMAFFWILFAINQSTTPQLRFLYSPLLRQRGRNALG